MLLSRASNAFDEVFGGFAVELLPTVFASSLRLYPRLSVYGLSCDMHGLARRRDDDRANHLWRAMATRDRERVGKEDASASCRRTGWL